MSVWYLRAFLDAADGLSFDAERDVTTIVDADVQQEALLQRAQDITAQLQALRAPSKGKASGSDKEAAGKKKEGGEAEKEGKEEAKEKPKNPDGEQTEKEEAAKDSDEGDKADGAAQPKKAAPSTGTEKKGEVEKKGETDKKGESDKKKDATSADKQADQKADSPQHSPPVPKFTREQLLRQLKDTLLSLQNLSDAKQEAAQVVQETVQRKLVLLDSEQKAYKSGEYLKRVDEPVVEQPKRKRDRERDNRTQERAQDREREREMAARDDGRATPIEKKKRSDRSKKAKKEERKKEEQEDAQYCVAGCKVAGGEMVACDNEDCQYGAWFHLECVNLRNAPSSKEWFCPSCRPMFSKKR